MSKLRPTELSCWPDTYRGKSEAINKIVEAEFTKQLTTLWLFTRFLLRAVPIRGQPCIILGTVLLAKLKFSVEGKSEMFTFRIVYLVRCQWLSFTMSGPEIRFARSMGKCYISLLSTDNLFGE